MLAALQLVTYVIDDLQFEINQSYKFDKDRAAELNENPPRDDVGLQYMILQNEEPRKYGLSLTISVNREEKEVENHFYRIKLTLFGEFIRPEAAPDPPENVDLDRYVLVSGLSILYGVARVKIADLTSGTPFKKVNMPTVTFDNIVDAMSEAATDDEVAEQDQSPPNEE